MIGDKLARGSKSAVFPSMGGNISQKAWDAIWEPEKKEIVEKKNSGVKDNE